MFSPVPADAVFKAIPPFLHKISMNSLLTQLACRSSWDDFLAYKTDCGHLPRKELLALSSFVNECAFLPVAEKILSAKGLGLPEKKLVNKIGKSRKRVVYTYGDAEMQVLKLLSFLLHRYSHKQPSGCYSFKKGQSPSKAVNALTLTPEISSYWCYKLDIANYFNSISIDILLPILKDVIDDDEPLYNFLQCLLSSDEAVFENRIIYEPRGVMAGTPVSPFLANIYLRELDEFFVDLGIPYARYSDDIILFAKTSEELSQYRNMVLDILAKYKLEINHEKEKIVPPHEEWEFLGISYLDGAIDLSVITRDKIKGKISRKARALRRWMLRKNAGFEQTMSVMIRIFNKKFFEGGNSGDLTWSRWFFPLINRSCGLKEIDNYLQQYIRFIPTGKHGKGNYKTAYEDLKRMGYRSLVHEYYAWKSRKID